MLAFVAQRSLATRALRATRCSISTPGPSIDNSRQNFGILVTSASRFEVADYDKYCIRHEFVDRLYRVVRLEPTQPQRFQMTTRPPYCRRSVYL